MNISFNSPKRQKILMVSVLCFAFAFAASAAFAALTFSADGITGTNGISLTGLVTAHDGVMSDVTRLTGAVGSFQPIAGDLTLQGAAGGTSSFQAGVMGNIHGTGLTNTVGYHAGVIGGYSVMGSDASTLPKAGVAAAVGIDGPSSAADAAFMAVLEGDAGVTTANAAYGVQYLNSTPGSHFNYGIDLSHAAAGFVPVKYGVADIRLSNGDTISNPSPGMIKLSGLSVDGKIVLSPTFNVANKSDQSVEADINLGTAWGTSIAQDTQFGGGVMGNVMGTDITTTNNYIGGLIGHYNISGLNSSVYPTGAVLGGIGDGSTTAKGAFVAYIDGDSGAVTKAGAAFKVMSNNSTPGNYFDYGIDLSDASHSGFNAVKFNKADIKLHSSVEIYTGDKITRDDVRNEVGAQGSIGSIYISTGGRMYMKMHNDGLTTDWARISTGVATD